MGGGSAASASDSDSDGYPNWLNLLRGIPCSRAVRVRVWMIRGGSGLVGSNSSDASGSCSDRKESLEISEAIPSLLSSTYGSAIMAMF